MLYSNFLHQRDNSANIPKCAIDTRSGPIDKRDGEKYTIIKERVDPTALRERHYLQLADASGRRASVWKQQEARKEEIDETTFFSVGQFQAMFRFNGIPI